MRDLLSFPTPAVSSAFWPGPAKKATALPQLLVFGDGFLDTTLDCGEGRFVGCREGGTFGVAGLLGLDRWRIYGLVGIEFLNGA